MMRNLPQRVFALFRERSGVAAIEMALLMPLLVMIFFGLIDASGLLSDNRRVTYAAGVAVDAVTRIKDTARVAEIDDVTNAVKLAMTGTLATDVRTEIYNYRLVGTAVTLVWFRRSNPARTCGNPSTADLDKLMTNNNDVIVAVVCAVHTPLLTGLIARDSYLGLGSFTLRKEVSMRPRLSPQLACTGCPTP